MVTNSLRKNCMASKAPAASILASTSLASVAERKTVPSSTHASNFTRALRPPTTTKKRERKKENKRKPMQKKKSNKNGTKHQTEKIQKF